MVIGPRHRARYLRRFEALSRPGARRLGRHWPAFLATSYWLLYRKMWGWAAVYLLAFPLLALCDGLIASASGPFQITLDGFGATLLAAYLVLPCLVADWLYLRHCNRLVRTVGRGLPRRKFVARLAARGGTSSAAAAVAGVGSGFVVVGVLAGLGLSVYADYDKREKVVEALKIGAGARAAVTAFVNRHGTIPSGFDEAGFKLPPLPRYVSRLDLDPRTGAIEIDAELSKAEGGAIYLVPQADAAKRIVWVCHTDAAIEAFAPRSCQGAD